MLRNLLRGNSIKEETKGLCTESRASWRDALWQIVASLGGHVEGIYYSFGDANIFLMDEQPDNDS